MTFCSRIGILDDGWAGLSDAARERLGTADVVIGAGRTLDRRLARRRQVATLSPGDRLSLQATE